MEKLLELLNEYDKEKGLHTFWKTTQSNKIQIYGKGVCSESYLYSKSYGFIKWLVDNDKIDFSREGEYCTKSIEEFDGLLRDDEDGLIMILAIQDEPIEFLCSILK